jgi:subtilisin family serine protease
MRQRACLHGFLAIVLLSLPGLAQDRLILRASSAAAVPDVVQKYGLTVVNQVDTAGAVFAVTPPPGQSAQEIENETAGDSEVSSVEADQATSIPEVSQSTAAILDSLPPASSVTFYGASVLDFYTTQPAVTITRLLNAQQHYNASGVGVVAIIDTGIDPLHQVLQSSIIPGYDFVHNIAGSASEWVDLNAQNQAALANSSPQASAKNTVAFVSQSTAAILDQSTAAILDYNHLPRAFGHGTMVAGIVHLAAPTAQIMPLKAFSADGSANLSDLLRAVYYAADHGANIINMSFTLTSPSAELGNAIQYATGKNVFCFAAAGNNGKADVGNPASLEGVMGIASTSNLDVLSLFSSYGRGVFLAAPGEGVVTTWPGQNYAEATGTSFSSPLVAGTASLALQVFPSITPETMRSAMGRGKHLKSNGIGHGRLDAVQALQKMGDEVEKGD